MNPRLPSACFRRKVPTVHDTVHADHLSLGTLRGRITHAGHTSRHLAAAETITNQALAGTISEDLLWRGSLSLDEFRHSVAADLQRSARKGTATAVEMKDVDFRLFGCHFSSSCRNTLDQLLVRVISS